MLLCLYHVLAWYTFSHRPDGLHGIVFIKEPIRREMDVERDTPGPCHHIESEIMSIDGEDGGWQVA